MSKFRNPKYIERYEDAIFDLETPLNLNVGNNAHQKKDGYRVVVDNSGEVTPFDWYNARISLDLKVNLLADGAYIALNDHNGIVVNSSHSFIENLDVELNGKKVYDCNDANDSVNIKNLLEYSPQYAQSTATNELTEERTAQANYNKGFAVRKALLGPSSTVNTKIPLNRYSFFESLRDERLPNTRVELNFEIESDGNLVWQAGADCRAIITRLELFIPRTTFLN